MAEHDWFVMVVEDNPDVQELLRETLSDAGYRAFVVETGEAALAALETVQPHLITLDFNLPGIGGIQLLQAIRERAGYESVPVIVISAQRQFNEGVRDLAQAVISKPFDLDDLLTTIRDLLPG
jgi:two-component system, OmpR family, phosphate regulon response regulator PhoB